MGEWRENPGREQALGVVGAALGVKLGIDLLEDRGELLARVEVLRRGVDELEQWIRTAQWRAVK